MITSHAERTTSPSFNWILEDDECCETQEGQANPSLNIDFKVSPDGGSLDLKVDASHACNILNLDIDLQIITADAALWKLRASEKGFFSLVLRSEPTAQIARLSWRECLCDCVCDK